jgi:hypothetical protein
MPLDENLIATLETIHRQTREAQNRLLARLREAEAEVQNLRQEIETLEKSAAQTESAIDSILVTRRSGSSRIWKDAESKSSPKTARPREADYDLDYEARYRETKRSNRSGNADPDDNGAYRSGGASSYLNQSRVPSISPNIEPISHRFSDRTITQACRILLREYGEALHVNELYNLLVAGGMEFNGNNPTISIAVSLNRNRQFIKVAPGTFDLVMRDSKPTYQKPDELTSIQ